LEFVENEWNNNVLGSYMHAIASLAFFIRPDKMNSFANILVGQFLRQKEQFDPNSLKE